VAKIVVGTEEQAVQAMLEALAQRIEHEEHDQAEEERDTVGLRHHHVPQKRVGKPHHEDIHGDHRTGQDAVRQRPTHDHTHVKQVVAQHGIGDR
jgi:hypothetical protein